MADEEEVYGPRPRPAPYTPPLDHLLACSKKTNLIATVSLMIEFHLAPPACGSCFPDIDLLFICAPTLSIYAPVKWWRKARKSCTRRSRRNP